MTTTAYASTRAGRNRTGDLLLFAAPVAAVAVGIAAEFADFRALRYPILLFMLTAVSATAYALSEGRGGMRTFAIALSTGVCAWAAAETLYVVLHVLRGERFDAERFGPQWAQALGLIAVHGVVLGAPTGAVAGILLNVLGWMRR